MENGDDRKGWAMMAKKNARRRSSQRRELTESARDKRYVKRRASGRFKESDDVGKSLSQDARRQAKRSVKSGHGDQGDRWRSSNKNEKK